MTTRITSLLVRWREGSKFVVGTWTKFPIFIDVICKFNPFSSQFLDDKVYFCKYQSRFGNPVITSWQYSQREVILNYPEILESGKWRKRMRRLFCVHEGVVFRGATGSRPPGVGEHQPGEVLPLPTIFCAKLEFQEGNLSFKFFFKL